MVFAHLEVRPFLINSFLLSFDSFLDFFDLFMRSNDFPGSECVCVSILFGAVSEDVIDRFNAILGHYGETISGGDRSPWNSLAVHLRCSAGLSCVGSRAVDHSLRPPCPGALHGLG